MTYDTIMPTVRHALYEALHALDIAKEHCVLGSQSHDDIVDAINSVKHALRLAGEK